MALDNYTGLQEEITSFLWDRTDVADHLPTFIALAEAQMFRLIDTRRMQDVDSSFAITAETASVPTGFAGVISFRITSQEARPPLEYRTPEQLEALTPNSGVPLYYSIVGDNFVFFPYPEDGETYTARLRYRKRPDALGSSTASNWILADHPDAYLYGSLLQAAMWLKEDEDVAKWGALFTTAINAMNDDDMRQSLGATLQLQPSAEVP